MFVFMNTFRVAEGRLDEYKAFVSKIVSAVEQNEPDMMQFGIYLNEETGEATSLQTHRTVDNFAVHMNYISQFMAEGRDLIDFSEMTATICGTPNEPILEQMRQQAGAGISVSISQPMASSTATRRRLVDGPLGGGGGEGGVEGGGSPVRPPHRGHLGVFGGLTAAHSERLTRAAHERREALLVHPRS